jgi:pimeloyl-ACP methyl ester carboxylesterase
MLVLALSLLFADSSHAFKVPLSPTESLYVQSTGAGQPVVLIPGLFGSAFGFRKLVPLLVEAGYHVYAIEPLGIGQSARPSKADYSMMAQADRIASVIDSLRLESPIVIAHSLGGALGFRLAYRHPGLVKGLISIEGGPTEQATTPGFRRAIKFASWLRVVGGAGLVRRKIKSSLVSSSGDASWVTDSVVRGYTSTAASNMGATLKGYLAMSSAREPEALAPHLVEIHAPVRLIVGTAQHDGDVSDEEVALLHRSLAAFGVDSVAGAGHFIQEERPQGIMISLDRLQQMLKGEPRKDPQPGDSP